MMNLGYYICGESLNSIPETLYVNYLEFKFKKLEKKKKAEIAKVTAETRPNHIPSPRKKLQNIKI